MSEMMNLSLDDFSELIGLIYEGLREPVPWGSLLVALRKFLKANWATLILRPASLDQPALLIRAGDRGAEIYGAAYNQYNVFSMDPFVGLPPDKVVTLDEMIDTQQWVNGEFYRQFIAPNDIRHILAHMTARTWKQDRERLQELIERAWARALRSFGQIPALGNVSAMYSMIAILSQMVRSPSISAGTFPDGENSSTRALLSVWRSGMTISSNGIANARSTSQGRSDHDE